MKKSLWAVIAVFIVLTACKDSSPPVFVSFKINGTEIDRGNPAFSAGINQTATFQIISSDDEELLQLLAYIDTTGLDDKERLYADGLSGKEAFSEFSFSMFSIDSLANRYFFGQEVPVVFSLLDNNQNEAMIVVRMSAL